MLVLFRGGYKWGFFFFLLGGVGVFVCVSVCVLREMEGIYLSVVLFGIVNREMKSRKWEIRIWDRDIFLGRDWLVGWFGVGVGCIGLYVLI